MRDTGSLPANVLEAIRRGDSIEAIKLLRASSGLGLKEAKDIVDQHSSGNPTPIVSAAPAGPLPPDVLEALRRGNKIEAIKLLRERTGLGLKEAKDAVEMHPQEKVVTAQDSPGQISSSGSAIWWLVALALALIAGYYFFRGPG
jgi:ribosomal protein L7/L12